MTIVNASNGATQLIGSQSASSSASIIFTNLSANYFKYILEIDSLVPASATNVQFTASVNNGSTYLTAVYAYEAVYSTSTTVSSAGVGSGGNFILLHATSGSSSDAFGITVELNNFGGSQAQKSILMQSYLYDGTSPYESCGGGSVVTGSAINAIKIAMSSGNITSGTFKLYGVFA